MRGYSALGQASGMMAYTLMTGALFTLLFIAFLVINKKYTIWGINQFIFLCTIIVLSNAIALAVYTLLWNVAGIYNYPYAGLTYPAILAICKNMFLIENPTHP